MTIVSNAVRVSAHGAQAFVAFESIRHVGNAQV
jgi:hypothetical protein